MALGKLRDLETDMALEVLPKPRINGHNASKEDVRGVLYMEFGKRI